MSEKARAHAVDGAAILGCLVGFYAALLPLRFLPELAGRDWSRWWWHLCMATITVTAWVVNWRLARSKRPVWTIAANETLDGRLVAEFSGNLTPEEADRFKEGWKALWKGLQDERGHCKDCKWWSQKSKRDLVEPWEGWGRCELMTCDHDEPLYPQTKVVAWGYESPGGITKPDFGCIQFEPREGWAVR